MPTLLALLIFLLPPCASEDANNCHWDATTNGNGQGSSFVVLDNHVINY